MKAFYSLLLLMAVTLTACDETITEKFLQLADGTSTSLVFNADENTEATIKFTADAAWTASVSEVAASKSGESISWLKLSAYGGEAGDCTITASITRNYTGASRKAEIKIVFIRKKTTVLWTRAVHLINTAEIWNFRITMMARWQE